MPKHRAHGDVWKYFTKLPNTINKAQCKFCKYYISRGGSNMTNKGLTTKSLWSHLNSVHKGELNEEFQQATVLKNEDGPQARERQPSTQEMLENNFVTLKEVNHPQALEITKLIAEAICIDMEPLNHVDKVGFNRLINKLCPQYKMVSSAHVSKTVLPVIYDRVKTRIKDLLKELKYIAITTILLSRDSSSMDDLISITAHGLTSSFESKAYSLEVLPFDGDNNSSENITRNIKEALIKWEITDRVIAIATNNDNNIVRAVKELSGDGYSYQHIACDAYTLQLALKHGLFKQNDVKDVIVTARKIVKHFITSRTSWKLLRATKNYLNLPAHVLVQDVTSSWDSICEMLKRLHEQRIAIEKVLPMINIQCNLSEQQWVLISKTVQISQFFRETTEALSKEGVPLSDVIPLINGILKFLENMSSNDEATPIRRIANELTKDISSRFQHLEKEKCYILSTVLNPRYKTRVFKTSATIARAKELLNLEIGLTAPFIPRAESQDTPSTSQASHIWNVCKELINEEEGYEPVPSYSSSSSLKEEVELYLKSPNIEIDDDPYKYWRQKQSFPNIKKLALKYLTFTPATVTSEKRLSAVYGPENVQLFFFLNKNLPVINFNY